MYSKLTTIFIIVLIAISVSFCNESIVKQQDDGKYVSVSDYSGQDYTAVQIAQGHGDLVKIFMKKLFNEELKDNPVLKRQLVTNNRMDMETFKRVFMRATNQYFESEGKDIRMTNSDYDYLLSHYSRLGKGTPEEASQFLREMNRSDVISDRILESCLNHIIRINRVLKEAEFPIKDAKVLLAPPIPDGPEEYPVQIFNEMAINSAETWGELMDNSDWIDDPELASWWDWFRNTDKGRAIGTVLSDAIGGIAFTLASGGNAIWAIAGGCASSVLFIAWAY